MLSDSSMNNENDDLKGFIDFTSLQNKKKEKESEIIEISDNEETDMYRQSEEEIDDLKNNIMEKKILYKEKAPSARHMGLKPLRIALLTLIFKSSRVAKKIHRDFYGLTLYECQKAMRMCNVSNHTIRDNLIKLVKMGLLKKNHMKIEGRPSKYTFYDLDESPLPCQDGAYLIWNRVVGKSGFYVISCPSYPHCSLRKEDCKILHHLRGLLNILPTYIKSKEGKINEAFIESPSEVDPLPSDESKPESKVRDDARLYGDLEDQDQLTIDDLVKRLRADAPPKSFKECKQYILKKYNVEIKHQDIYHLMDESAPEPSDEETEEESDETAEKITKEWLEWDDLDDGEKKKVGDRVRDITGGYRPKSYKECVQMIEDEFRVKINYFNVSMIEKGNY